MVGRRKTLQTAVI